MNGWSILKDEDAAFENVTRRPVEGKEIFMRKRLVFFVTAIATVCAAVQAQAQCISGRCFSNASRVVYGGPIASHYRISGGYVVNYGMFTPNVVGACSEVVSECEPCAPVLEPRPCEPAQETGTEPEPCEPVSKIEPCAPVQPCEPVQTCDQFREGTEMVIGECVNGACPIRKVLSGAASTVQTVAATARFLIVANALRARYGLAPLKADVGLDAGCRGQVGICARRGALVHGAGCAEILAQNTVGFEYAVSQWATSREHAALLLNPSFRYAGVAVERDANGRFWCAMRFR